MCKIIGKIRILRLSQNPGFILISVLSALTEINVSALALKKGLSNDQNAKIGNWVNMHIFNELRHWFRKRPMSCPNECAPQI